MPINTNLSAVALLQQIRSGELPFNNNTVETVVQKIATDGVYSTAEADAVAALKDILIAADRGSPSDGTESAPAWAKNPQAWAKIAITDVLGHALAPRRKSPSLFARLKYILFSGRPPVGSYGVRDTGDQAKWLSSVKHSVLENSNLSPSMNAGVGGYSIADIAAKIGAPMANMGSVSSFNHVPEEGVIDDLLKLNMSALKGNILVQSARDVLIDRYTDSPYTAEQRQQRWDATFPAFQEIYGDENRELSGRGDVHSEAFNLFEKFTLGLDGEQHQDPLAATHQALARG